MSIKKIITAMLALAIATQSSAKDDISARTEHTLDFIHQFSVLALESEGNVDCNEFGKELLLLEEKNFYIPELADSTNFARGIYTKYCYHEAKFYSRANPRAKAASHSKLNRDLPWEIEDKSSLKYNWSEDFSEKEEDEITNAIYDDKFLEFARKAYCSKTKDNIRCTYHAATGKSLSIVRLPEEFRKYTDSYLVCSQAAYTKGLRVLVKWREGYNITHMCAISKAKYAKYRNKKASEIDDDGISQLFSWSASKYGSPIETPKALEAQCKIGFKDAHFCTPTMIVLPTEHTYKKTVCSLETKATNTNLLIARVSSTKSKWECDTFNLLQTYYGTKGNKEDCIDNKCALPYIPEAR